jgi:hypothetical protein
MEEYKEDESIPKHVQSIKSQHGFKRNREFNMAQLTPRPHPTMLQNLPHQDHQGENPIIKELKHEDLMEEIRKWKCSIRDCGDESTTTEKIIKALGDVEEAIGNHAPKAGELKKKFELGKASVGIDSKNITAAARNRKKPELKIKDVQKMCTK